MCEFETADDDMGRRHRQSETASARDFARGSQRTGALDWKAISLATFGESLDRINTIREGKSGSSRQKPVAEGGPCSHFNFKSHSTTVLKSKNGSQYFSVRS